MWFSWQGNKLIKLITSELIQEKNILSSFNQDIKKCGPFNGHVCVCMCVCVCACVYTYGLVSCGKKEIIVF